MRGNIRLFYWVEEQGGIQVLLEKLQSGGLGAILSTWLSNQQGNQSVSGEQLESALGTNAVSDLGKNLAWIPVQLPVYWQNNCRRLLMRSHRKVKCHHKPITILLSAGMELLKGKLFR